MREISSPLDGFASPFGPQRGFNPLRIFANDEPGVWFEANDATTLFTDVAGTTPVTTPGDAVALQLDKSQGLTLGPELVDADLNTLFADRAEITATATEILFDTTVGDQISSTLGGSIASGSTYEVSFEVFDVVSGGAVLRLGSNAISDTASLTAGSYSFKLNADGTEITFRTGQPDTELKIRNISVKELPGNHRTQATTAARPLYALHPVGGVRNLLEYTEEFDNAVWTKSAVTVTANSTTAPDGETTSDKLIETTGAGAHLVQQQFTSLAAEYTLTCYMKQAERSIGYIRAFDGIGHATYFDLSAGTVLTSAAGNTATITLDENGFYRCSVSRTYLPTASALFQVGCTTTDNVLSYTGDGISGIFIWGAQLEQSSTATNYQKVRSFLDVSEEGKARRGRIWYNGTSHFMQTGTITPGTDKVQVFAGVNRIGTSDFGIISEFSSNASTNSGTLYLLAPGAASEQARFGSRGSLGIKNAGGGTRLPPPTANVLTGLGDISGDSAILRVDGIQEAISTADQGAGNYLAYPLYFGARAGSSLFFNGYEDTSIIRFGPNLDASVIGKVESYVASKTPEPTL